MGLKVEFQIFRYIWYIMLPPNMCGGGCYVPRLKLRQGLRRQHITDEKYWTRNANAVFTPAVQTWQDDSRTASGDYLGPNHACELPNQADWLQILWSWKHHSSFEREMLHHYRYPVLFQIKTQIPVAAICFVRSKPWIEYSFSSLVGLDHIL